MIIYFLMENFDVFLSVLRTRQHISTWRHVCGCGPRAADTNPNMYKNIWRNFKKRKKKAFQRELPSLQCNTFTFHSSFVTMENGRKKNTKLDRKVDQTNQILTSSTSASRSVSHVVKTSVFNAAYTFISLATLYLSYTIEQDTSLVLVLFPRLSQTAQSHVDNSQSEISNCDATVMSHRRVGTPTCPNLLSVCVCVCSGGG